MLIIVSQIKHKLNCLRFNFSSRLVKGRGDGYKGSTLKYCKWGK